MTDANDVTRGGAIEQILFDHGVLSLLVEEAAERAMHLRVTAAGPGATIVADC